MPGFWLIVQGFNLGGAGRLIFSNSLGNAGFRLCSAGFLIMQYDCSFALQGFLFLQYKFYH